MELVYDIVLTPDPDNPTQQAAGNTIFDHRIWGQDVTSLAFSSFYYLSDYFNKNIASSTLTAPDLSWSVGNKVKIICNSSN